MYWETKSLFGSLSLAFVLKPGDVDGACTTPTCGGVPHIIWAWELADIWESVGHFALLACLLAAGPQRSNPSRLEKFGRRLVASSH